MQKRDLPVCLLSSFGPPKETKPPQNVILSDDPKTGKSKVVKVLPDEAVTSSSENPMHSAKVIQMFSRK
jgi:hypothetical protein